MLDIHVSSFSTLMPMSSEWMAEGLFYSQAAQWRHMVTDVWPEADGHRLDVRGDNVGIMLVGSHH